MIRDIEMTIGLFPGQGAYRRGALLESWQDGDPVVRQVYEAVESAAKSLLGKSLTSVVFGAEPPTAEALFRQHPDLMQLAVYAQSVSTFLKLREQGVELSCLAGHSMGEIAALVCGGAFDVADGAALLCERIRVLRELDTSGGRMIALSAPAEQVEAILALVGDPDTVVAVRNGPHQTVVSGPSEPLRAVSTIAAALKVSSTVLRSPHPFHNPLLHAARGELSAKLARFAPRPLTVPVYSPISQRFYRDGDDLAGLLALHLVAPLDFGTAVNRLWQAGGSAFVEIGPGSGLAAIVVANAPAATVVDPYRASSGGNPIVANSRFPTGLPRASGTTVEEPVRVAPATAVRELPSVPAPRPALASEKTTRTDSRGVPAEGDRDRIFQRVRSLYAEALGYPEEVLTAGAVFEAELGIDSVQQTDLLQQVRKLYGLRDGDGRSAPTNLATLADLVDHVVEHASPAGAAS